MGEFALCRGTAGARHPAQPRLHCSPVISARARRPAAAGPLCIAQAAGHRATSLELGWLKAAARALPHGELPWPHRTPPCSPNQSGASSHPAPGSVRGVGRQSRVGVAACWIQRASPYSDGNIARIAEINTQEFCEVSIRLWTGSRITIDSIEVRFLVPSRLRDTLLPSIPDCDDRSRRCHKSLGSAREFYTRRHVGARQPTLHAL